MNKLVEKIKSLDKKILIGAGAGIVALIIAIVVILVVALGGKDTNNDKDDTDTKDKIEKEEKEDKDESEDEAEAATFLVKVTDAEGNPVAGVSIQLIKDESLTATSDDTGVATFNVEITEGYKLSGVTCPEGYEYTGEAEIALEAGAKEYPLTVQKKQVETSDSSSGGATQLGTTTKEDGTEVLGEGSKSNPCMLDFIGDSMTVTTTSIPAGKEMYFGIYKIGNLILTINNPNAYVIESNGTRHDASNGKVSFQVENALASDAVYFTIGNKGSSATTFTIQRENPTGSFMNPTNIKTIGNDVKISLADGNEVGHYYKYIAEKSGTIRFYMTATVSSVMSVTNNRNSAQRTTDADALTDSQGKQYVELEVNQGDEIIIVVGAARTVRGKYPATTITWNGKYN